MLLMKLALSFNAFIGFIAVMLVRFLLTIAYGPDEALRRAQQGATDWASENQEGIAAFTRLMQSPVKVIMPEPPEPETPAATLYMAEARPAEAPAVQHAVDGFVGLNITEVLLWGSWLEGVETSHITVVTEKGCLDFGAEKLGFGVWDLSALDQVRKHMGASCPKTP